MPFYVSPKLPDGEKLKNPPKYSWSDVPTYQVTPDMPSFPTRADAFMYLKEHHTPETHAVYFVLSDIEEGQWHTRENRRFMDGIYQHVPWQDRNLFPTHHVHLSKDCPGKVAYTETPEHGVADRQTRTTPGRYLEKYYGSNGAMSTEEIATYVAIVTGQGAKSFSLATTIEEVRSVYLNGPRSCMGGVKWRSFGGQSPVDVYAGPDLAVAYFGPIDSPSQRAVVWPAKRIYSRIYGTGPLEYLLKEADYSHDTLSGARVRAIECNGGYLMPYVDSCDYADLDGEYFILTDGDGEYGVKSTDGVIYGDQPECRHCGRRCHADDMNGDLCDSCADDAWTCDDCHEEFFDADRSHNVGDDYVCGSCFDARHEECADVDCSNRWIEEHEFTEEETAARKRQDMADLCRACAARYVYCETCETPYDPTVDSVDENKCPTCGRYPRPDDHPALPLETDTIGWIRLEVQERLSGTWRPCYIPSSRSPARISRRSD